MDDLLQNFPNRIIAGLNVVIFPTGRHYLAPSDKLDRIIKLAKILQVPNATCSRIGRGRYLTGEHNPVGLLEEALVDVIAAGQFISGSVKSWVKTCRLPVWMNWRTTRWRRG